MTGSGGLGFEASAPLASRGARVLVFRRVAATSSATALPVAGSVEFPSTRAGRFAAAVLELSREETASARDEELGRSPSLSAALSSLRSSSEAAARSFPLPSLRVEAWRQTDVAGLLAHPPAPAPGLADEEVFRAAGAVAAGAREAPRGGLLAVVVDGVLERLEVGQAVENDEAAPRHFPQLEPDQRSAGAKRGERGELDEGEDRGRDGGKDAVRGRKLAWFLTPSGLGAHLREVTVTEDEAPDALGGDLSGSRAAPPAVAAGRKRLVPSGAPVGYFGRLAEAPDDAVELSLGLATQPSGSRPPEHRARGGFFGALSGLLARDVLALWIGEGAKVPGTLRVVHARTVHRGRRRAADAAGARRSASAAAPRVEVCAPRVVALLESDADAALLEEALEVHVEETPQTENEAGVRVRIRSYFERNGNGNGSGNGDGNANANGNGCGHTSVQGDAASGEGAQASSRVVANGGETADFLASEPFESLDSDEEDGEDAEEAEAEATEAAAGDRRSSLRSSPRSSSAARRSSPVLRAGARPPSRLSLPVLEVSLDDGARLAHSVVSLLHPSAAEMRSTVVDQATSSTYALVECRLGGSMVRHEADVLQLGPATHTRLRHLHVAGHGSLHEARTRLELRHPDGTADQLHKAVVASDRGKGVFDGAVAVGRLAQRTDAAQLTRALLLAPKATFHAKPNLRIVADDVKCTHGASVADLDPDGSFYLRTRGVDAKTARGMLVRAFAAEIVEELGETDVVNRVARAAFRELERAAEEGGDREA